MPWDTCWTLLLPYFLRIFSVSIMEGKLAVEKYCCIILNNIVILIKDQKLIYSLFYLHFIIYQPFIYLFIIHPVIHLTTFPWCLRWLQHCFMFTLSEMWVFKKMYQVFLIPKRNKQIILFFIGQTHIFAYTGGWGCQNNAYTF